MWDELSPSLVSGHRFPVEIISHCVWLYFRFTLSFRDVEEMMATRGVAVTYESIREWCLSSVGSTPGGSAPAARAPATLASR